MNPIPHTKRRTFQNLDFRKLNYGTPVALAFITKSGCRANNRPSVINHQKHVILSMLTALLTHVALAENTNQSHAIGFQPLEIYKFKNGANRLIVTDINQDGRDDILFANNHVSRLEILLRKESTEPVEELPELQARFDDKGMIVDQSLKAIRVADLNNDNLPDIATFGTAIGLQIRYQQPDGSFAEPERVFIKAPGSVTTIQLGDLNGDNLQDILVCRRKEADLLWNASNRPFQEHKTLTFSADKCFYGDIADINNDGTNDLAFLFSTTRNPLKIRFGKGEGLYGIEQPVDLPPRQYIDILQHKDAKPKIGMVLRNRLAFRTYGFTHKEQPPLQAALEASPARIGLEGTSKKADPAWLAGDFNSDGYDDLLVSAPELSRLHLYTGSADGLNPEPQRIDTLSEVTHLSRITENDILVISKKEKVAALHSTTDLHRFPKIIKTPGDVLAGCASEATESAWMVCKNSDRELLLVHMETDTSSFSAYPLNMRNDPADLLAFQLPDNQTGVLFFMAYDTPKMMIFNGTDLQELTSESFRALTLPLSADNIRLETPGRGHVLTVSQGAIARRFKWNGIGYDVSRQFNPENPRGELVASCAYQLLDGSAGTLLYDRNSGDLVRYNAEGNAWGKIHIPDANQTIFSLVQLANEERDIIILLDRTGFSEILGNGMRLDVMSEAEYVSPSEDPKLAYAKAVHLGSPPRPLIALIDPANRAIELVGQTMGKLEKKLAFEVFLTSDFVDHRNNRGTEPHDVESGDLNGDGIGDLVVLSHDKLLIYLGE